MRLIVSEGTDQIGKLYSRDNIIISKRDCWCDDNNDGDGHGRTTRDWELRRAYGRGVQTLKRCNTWWRAGFSPCARRVSRLFRVAVLAAVPLATLADQREKTQGAPCRASPPFRNVTHRCGGDGERFYFFAATPPPPLLLPPPHPTTDRPTDRPPR